MRVKHCSASLIALSSSLISDLTLLYSWVCDVMANVCVFVCVCVKRFYKKAAAFVLRAVAKHSPELSQAVVACGGVDALVLCLEEFDPGVKEAAAWALGNMARHNACKESHFCLPSVVGFFSKQKFSPFITSQTVCFF